MSLSRSLNFYKYLTLSLMTVALVISVSCSKSSDSSPVSTESPLILKVTKETYINGRQFCETYSEITNSEFGKWIKVPLDYSKPDRGTLEIYAYTTTPFDPNKPSVILVDGGPGQNTHGKNRMSDLIVNEISFDQRGLGCSAPENWEIYSDATIYSSENNVLDMEEIRKAYQIEKWSVYGISYGTVPATMYASKFANSTSSLVLEGVVGTHDNLHRMDYKIEKLNLVYKSLNEKQKMTYGNLIKEQDTYGKALLLYAFLVFYQDEGLRKYSKIINLLIDQDGNINERGFDVFVKKLLQQKRTYHLPQQPMAVDQNIFTIIACKNLERRKKNPIGINFSHANGFYETYTDDNYDRECEDAGVSKFDEKPYRLEDYKVTSPTYYLQGSHDGATLARGALQHWKAVLKNRSYFLLSKKGGHNPLIAKLAVDNSSIANAHRHLITDTFKAVDLTQDHISNVNKTLLREFNWIMYRENQKDSIEGAFKIELEGIQLQHTSFKGLLTYEN